MYHDVIYMHNGNEMVTATQYYLGGEFTVIEYTINHEEHDFFFNEPQHELVAFDLSAWYIDMPLVIRTVDLIAFIDDQMPDVELPDVNIHNE